ncbi:MAG: DUF1799 domain-containing protein [Rhizomicrobium sp.]
MDEETIAEMQQMGVGAKTLAKARAKLRGQTIEVEPENAGAVRLFLALGTQWRHVMRSNGKIEIMARTGLDYAAVPATATALALGLDEMLLAGLRILEDETLRLHAARVAKTLGR